MPPEWRRIGAGRPPAILDFLAASDGRGCQMGRQQESEPGPVVTGLGNGPGLRNQVPDRVM